MTELIDKLKSNWIKNSSATDQQIRTAEEKSTWLLPNDYKLFLMWSNGGEGQIGNCYLSLWRVEELTKLNSDYQIQRYLGRIFGIGSDGGGTCFALDYRASKSNPTIVQVPFGDLDLESVISLGENFTNWLEILFQAE